ncbi:RNA polymerase factor sigma-54 [Undibacter mobilis]|uniref:RNA polymerase sigma-54 factor n=1 Tax=Undibacter mobilis TaxID=2292256 RepID=A0A371B948_9BRAD|nr:RNA polymerase factor sigma-54 [Undibacter mobilis]RDV04125.1 RNA polymerase sigma-54 factor [Undibacter mobilis]
MALSQRLEFRQSQALVMTPQLMQAIKLLQLSSLDLQAYVDNELEKNPLLERGNAEDGPAEAPEHGGDADSFSDTTGEGGRDDGAQESGLEGAQDWIGADLETSRSSMEQGLGTELENVFPDDGGEKSAPVEAPPPAYSEWSGSGGGGADDSDYNLEAFVSAEVTLGDHLAAQMALAIGDYRQRMIGQYLIDMVDETGYLTGDLESVAEKLGCSVAEVEAVLSVLQTLDPPGICARSLTECLSLQLKERDRFDPAMQKLVENLPLLAKRDLAALRRLCGVDDEDLADMIAEIRSLNPKPGLAFGTTLVQPIVPDVFVRAASDGTWQVELNSDTLPKVLISQKYHTQVSKTARNDKDKAYLADCLQTATWLVRALDQRAKTILKVSSEIVRQQDGFFVKGVQHLRPLNLKTVADAIGMHESTVSRVTANKYMATSRGIFELKYFFTSSIASADGGEAHSAEAVRHRIRTLIDAECPSDVLSDDTIVEKLRGAGIDIARRTVAKYREAMRIPSSVQRRREKQAANA